LNNGGFVILFRSGIVVAGSGCQRFVSRRFISGATRDEAMSDSSKARANNGDNNSDKT
jgi:hypothetical protein